MVGGAIRVQQGKSNARALTIISKIAEIISDTFVLETVRGLDSDLVYLERHERT